MCLGGGSRPDNRVIRRFWVIFTDPKRSPKWSLEAAFKKLFPII
jgi:hypothetical protein